MESEPAAAAALDANTEGYPYFIREYASAAWLAHRGDVIRKADVNGVAAGVRNMLDESVYGRQFARISPREANELSTRDTRLRTVSCPFLDIC